MRLQPRCRVTAAGLFLLSGLPSQSRFRNDGEGEDADRKDIFMFKWIKKHYEVLSYLIFGVLTTLLNILLYALFNRLFGYTAANSWGNVLDNILCILFAYATNRAFVFRSKTRGRETAHLSPAVWVQCCWILQLCWCWAICWRPRAQR